MDLRRQLTIVRNWLPLLVGTVVLAGGVTYFLAGLQPKVFEARTTLIVGQSLTGVNPDYNQLLVSQRLSATYAAVATTYPILERVIEELGLPETPGQLAARITASSSSETAFLSLAVRDADPARAAAIADALAEELIAASPAVQGRQTFVLESIREDLESIRAEIQTAQASISRLAALPNPTPEETEQLEALRERVAALRETFATTLTLLSNNATNALSIVQPAIAPESPIAPRPIFNAMIAAMVGLLAAAGIAFLSEYLDDRIRDAERVEQVLGLPTLGSIPLMKRGRGRGREELYRLATLLYPQSRDAEAYRTLRTSVEFSAVDMPLQTLLVTSALPGEGKTVTAANLSIVFAQSGRRVLLVDADLRRPAVHGIFRLRNEHGLTTLLRRDDAPLAAIVQPTELAKLDILTAGPVPPNPAELLGSQRMRSVLPSLTAAYDLVIFDAPPVEVVTDAAVLSTAVDGTILVVEGRKSRQATVRSARDKLRQAGATVLGVCLNGLKPGENYHYYQSTPALEPLAAGDGPHGDPSARLS